MIDGTGMKHSKRKPKPKEKRFKFFLLLKQNRLFLACSPPIYNFGLKLLGFILPTLWRKAQMHQLMAFRAKYAIQFHQPNCTQLCECT